MVSLAFMFFMAYTVIPRALVTMTKAAPSTKISINNSYVLADQILATANGKDVAKINVFILDSSGKGIPDKEVSLSGMDSIVNSSVMTDKEGKAAFRMTSSKAGQFELEASVAGVPLPKKITVTFREE